MITERQFAPNLFQHCATISKGPPGAGTFLAYYTGEAEMHQTQHVRLHWWSDEGREAEPVDFDDYTGNPILLETLEGTRIIYSKFEKLVPNRVEWWQHCSLWSRAVDVYWSNGKPIISVGAPKQIIFDEPGDVLNEIEGNKPPTGLGYLARCNAIWYKDRYLLPLYREHAPYFHGTVVQSKNGIDWEYLGTIGRGTRCIQPTIWEEDGKLCTLMRRFSRNSLEPYAYYSESLDGGKTWSELENSKYPNCNNSILKIDKEDLVIWNDDFRGRSNITLGTLGETPRRIAKLDNYGSYPAACTDSKHLYVVYTTRPNPLKTPNVKSVIKVKTYDLETLRSQVSKNKAWSTTSKSVSLPSSSSPWRAVKRTNSPKTGDPSQP